MRVMVTGATGFVGRALCAELMVRGYSVRAALRQVEARQELSRGVEPVIVGTISAATDWRAALAKCDAVVHLAARVHVTRDEASDPMAEFRAVNVDSTLNLALQAAAAGARRFVYLSSIKVNGEVTQPNCAFSSADVPAPLTAYGISKLEAEDGLRALAVKTGVEVVIIRPPLVYGPGVKANFLSMMRWLWRGIPLPLGAIHNRRSLVGLDNLVDLIVTIIDHPATANQTFLACDGEDLSTTELLLKMGDALGKPAKLISVPADILVLGAKLLGKPEIAQRLCCSLQVDISKARKLLGWMPPVSVDEGFRRTARHFLASLSGR
ncbi:MAG: SDR family oxidoreductase [Desulfurivibrionaceae bacterium]